MTGIPEIVLPDDDKKEMDILSEQDILEQTLEGMITRAHKDLMVYHVNRDSTMIEAFGRRKSRKRRLYDPGTESSGDFRVFF